MESKIKTSSNNSYSRKSQKPLYIDMGKRGDFSLDKVLMECPRTKRYDIEQLIKHALNLVRDVDN